MKLYQRIASAMKARENSLKNNNETWFDKHTETIEKAIKDNFPHGSGFDGNTWLDFELSNPQKLVFFSEYHHMNENGYYDGWSTLKVIVKPDLAWGFDFKLTGIQRKYRFNKDYFEDVFNQFLDMDI